jgi:hypothetical protein
LRPAQASIDLNMSGRIVIRQSVDAFALELVDYRPRWLAITMIKFSTEQLSKTRDNLRRAKVAFVATTLGVAALTAACGGGTASAPPASAVPAPSAEAPVPAASTVGTAAPSLSAPETAPAAPSAGATSEADPTSATKSTSGNSQNTPASGTPTPTDTASQSPLEAAVSASELLTAPKVAFLIDYANSDVKAKAQATCEKDPKKDDPAAMSACLQKARNQFMPDVLVFQKAKRDNATLIIYKRNESELKEIYVASVEFANVTAHSVQLKIKGASRGQRALFKNTNSPILNLPNDYSIEIDDPEFGMLRYDAKVGFIDK